MGGGLCRGGTLTHMVQPVKKGECTSDVITPRSSAASRKVEDRIASLELLVDQQASALREMTQALVSVTRDSRRTVSVLQYNILAAYLGKNTQPWFLYGADLSQEERQRVMKLYYERGADGRPKHGWPQYVEGILSPAQIAAVELRDQFFRWENRKVRLLGQIREFDADVVSLVELDQHSYFQDCLKDTWDSVFHKRPRECSLDGCGIFWRRAKFDLVAQQGFHFVDGSDDKGRMKQDRCCLMILLRWKVTQDSLVVISTHLAKDPDNRAQTALRVRQVTQLMESLTDFTHDHNAVDAPVILMGDLNARHLGEIRGIARTVWQIKGSPIHKFLWAATDVPTGPTSITKARQCRIDVVQFLSSQLEVLDVLPVPKLPRGEVIPNVDHPSDHLPVCVRFKLKDTYQKHKECAQSWLECVAGSERLHPLTELELRDAFDFFDRDRSGVIHRHDLEEACLDLQVHLNVDVQELLLDCFPDKQISYANFIRAYEARLKCERIRCIGDLEYAFQFFANDSSFIQIGELEAAFREIIPISFSDDEVKDMVRQLNMKEGQDVVDLHRFCEVVCQATFPTRDRRKRLSYKGNEGRSRTESEDCNGFAFANSTTSESRSFTKELGLKLELLSCARIDSKPFLDASSPMSLRHIDTPRCREAMKAAREE